MLFPFYFIVVYIISIFISLSVYNKMFSHSYFDVQKDFDGIPGIPGREFQEFLEFLEFHGIRKIIERCLHRTNTTAGPENCQ